MEDKKKKVQVVDPNGHIVFLAPGQEVREGWQVATDEDIAVAAALEADRRKIESARDEEALEELRASQLGSGAPKGGPLK